MPDSLRIRSKPKRRSINLDRKVAQEKISESEFIQFLCEWDQDNSTVIKLLCYLYSHADETSVTPELSVDQILKGIGRQRSAMFKAKEKLIATDLIQETGQALKYELRIPKKS